MHLGFPRLSPDQFDLVVATPEYPIADHPKVLRVPLALTRSRLDRAAARQEVALPSRFKAPRSLLVLGGPSLYWALRPTDVLEALSSLLDRAAMDGGSVLVVGSPRTPREVLSVVERGLAAANCAAMLVPLNGPPGYPQLLAASDRIFVTADSVAMVSEAIATGSPVGLVPIRRTLFGRAIMNFMDQVRPNERLYPRDLRFFWKSLKKLHLVGSIQNPAQGKAPNITADVAAQVLRLLD